MSNEENKLQIDDDWKSAAAAEKEKLAAEVEGARPAREMGPLPDPNFIEIIQILAMQAMVGLGGMRGPGGQEIPPNLEVAKHHIDLLSVLEQKTEGKLEPQEKQILNTTLYQLRIAYVEAMQAVTGGGRR
ncbi:MAG TPA: DUF1844 domain-containing protein [Phycisphaerae bacterium]|nr:DUF1844 domain-containing protein [Phycisphaerae bacterium]